MPRPTYKILEVTAENPEDMYCSRSKRKEEGYQNKIKWIKQRFKEGLRYWSLLVDEGRKDYSYRGMIEAMPGDKCWRGIDAPNYMVIHCLWVIGKNKGKGYGTKLVNKVIESAKKNNMDGVAVMTVREKKGGWTPKSNIFEKNDFSMCDSILDTFDIHALKFNENAPDPKFVPLIELEGEYKKGTHVFVSYQCPYMAGTIKSLQKLAEDEFNEEVSIHEMSTYEDARKYGFHPYGTFHITRNGRYITHLPGGFRDIQKEFEKL